MRFEEMLHETNVLKTRNGNAIVRVSGTVVEEPFVVGSKVNQLKLKTDSGITYALHRSGGNSFYDPELKKYLGKRIQCTAELIRNNILFIIAIKALTANENPSDELVDRRKR